MGSGKGKARRARNTYPPRDWVVRPLIVDDGIEWRIYDNDNDDDPGVLHREDGPAVEKTDGTREWWLHDECHREDGPAVVHPDGSTEWWLDDLRHREDGPAVEGGADGVEEWWIEGEKLSSEEVEKLKKKLETAEQRRSRLEDEQSGITKKMRSEMPQRVTF